MEQIVTIQTGDAELTATLHYPAVASDEKKRTEARYPTVIICHGFIGNRIGVDRLFVKTARYLAASNHIVLRFDYAGCGESAGDYGQGGMDDLILQTRHVIDYALGIERVDPNRIILLGHSLGGAVALLTAVKDSRVRSLVLWAAVANPFTDIVRIVGEKAYDLLSQSAYIDYLGYRLTSKFFESLSKYHPLLQTRNFAGNVLLVHGSGDDVIPVDYCFLYQRAFLFRSGARCDKEVILGANHTFSSISHFNQLLRVTSSWLAADQRNIEWTDWVI
ncbi:alpha/beta hydrolase family protein [Effusibacillus lacus]|uniref:alpha/beta hydrolase family protein n=1 Tax=Effusibacillus lacus TaxID=1348429 RepID=UPI000BB87F07|nr:alpha/beta fold hydrolase [Effusibacillus lacus]